jgi:MATE family multidrug resistance protein
MQGVFRGTGRNVLGAYINLFAYFAIGLPFGLYLAFPLAYGVEGLWLGLTAGIFVGCIMSIYKIYNTNWEDMTDAARIRTS